MEYPVLVVLGVAFAGLILVVLPVALATYMEMKGKRSVVCPETRRAARIGIDATKAALGAALGVPRFRVRVCSLWPHQGRCARECLNEFRPSPVTS
jgi:hypothetical protein